MIDGNQARQAELSILLGGKLAVGVFAGGTLFNAFSRMLASMWVARITGPFDYSAWNLLSLVLAYGGLTHFGILNGLRRELPFQLGRGDAAESDKLIAAGLMWGVTPAAMLGLGLPFILEPLGVSHGLGFATALALLANQVQLVGFAILQSSLRFRMVGYLNFLAGCTTLVAAGLAGILGLSALPVALAAGSAAAAVPCFWWCRPATPLSLSFSTTSRLFSIGFPILLAGLFFGFLTTLDRLFIAHTLGSFALGLYTPAIIAFTALNLVRQLIGEQFYPRMNLALGRGNDVKLLLPMAREQNRLSQLVLLALIVLGVIAAPSLIAFFMPSYQQGVAAAQFAMLSVLPLCVGAGEANLLNSCGRQGLYLVTQSVYIVLGALLLVIGLHAIQELWVVPVSNTITYLLYGITLSILGRRVAARRVELRTLESEGLQGT